MQTPARRNNRTLAVDFRTAAILLCALAFALQSYVVQTHIHPGLLEGTETLFSLQSSAPNQPDRSDRDGFPLPDDPSKCPICQIVVQAGTYVTPAVAPIVSIVGVAIREIPFVLNERRGPVPVSYNWRGRAPPQT